MSSTDVNRPYDPPVASDGESPQLVAWQTKLLPFTMRFLVVMAIAFFALSMLDVYQTRGFVRDETAGEVKSKVEALILAESKTKTAGGSPEVIWKSLLLLEADAMDKRYRQASALLMSRIWTRQLAFITGMILALVGAVFILSKLREERTEVSAGAKDWKTGVSSTSPGLVLAFLGTTLIGISLVFQPRIEVQDRPIYFSPLGLATVAVASGKADAPAAGTMPSPRNPFGKPPEGASTPTRAESPKE